MSIDLGRRVAKLNYGDPFTAYTGITITSPDSEDKFSAGNDSGRILEVEIPWASQTMADNLLDQFNGVQHQPFTATGAILDPAAEIGDSVTIDGVSGIMYRRDQRLGSLYRADISAPGDEEINHEIPYYPPIQRAVTRFGNVARGAASLAAQSMARQDGIEEDFKELTATVTDVQAGMKAYVKNDTFNDYKESVAQLFAGVNEEDENMRTELTLHASSIEGLQEATASLLTRVNGAETALEMQSQAIDDLYAANVSLAARADNAEAELSLHAETLNGVSASIATLSADVQAGMKAYVKNDTFNDYKESVAQLFAGVNEEDENIRSELTLHASSIEGLQEASAALMARVSGAETALEMQSQSLDDLQTARTELAARVDLAEASLEQKAEKKTVQDLDESVKTLYTAQTNLNTRIGNAESSLTQKVSVTDFDEALAAEQQAITELSAQVDGAEAKISLNAQNINGVTSSLATIQADVVKLQGRVNLTDVAYVSEGNGLGVKGSIVANGNLLVSGYIGTTANGPIVLAGKNFTPQKITSTTGAILALGAA